MEHLRLITPAHGQRESLARLEFPSPASCFGGTSTYIGAMFKTLHEIYWMAMFVALAVGLGLAIVEGAYQVVHYIA
jgi:hypothetical protein